MEHNGFMPFLFRSLRFDLVFSLLVLPLMLVSILASMPSRAEESGAAASKEQTKTSAKSSQATPSTTQSVTRVVGEAGPRIVTSREVRLNSAIGQVLRSRDPVTDKNSKPSSSQKLKLQLVAVDDPTFPVEVWTVLDEWTVYLEAVEIGSKPIDKAEVALLVKSVGEAWQGSAEWESLEASPAEIKEVVERKLITASLEHLKSDASLVNVSEAEALQYFKKNRLRFGNLPFENFKDNIKAALVKTQTERRLNEWRAVLRRKYRVRNFVGA